MKELGAGADGKEADEDKVVELLAKAKADLRLDYLVTGSQVPYLPALLRANRLQLVTESLPGGYPAVWIRTRQYSCRRKESQRWEIWKDPGGIDLELEQKGGHGVPMRKRGAWLSFYACSC